MLNGKGALVVVGIVTALSLTGCTSTWSANKSVTKYQRVQTPSGPVDCVIIRTVKGAGVTCDWSKRNG